MQVNYPPNNFSYFSTPPGQQPPLPLATGAALPVQDPSAAAPGTFTDLMPLQQRQELAANALQEGSSTAPAQGGYVTGLARLAQAFMGGKLLNKANTDISAAKKNNAEVMMGAVNNGDWATLATSDNDQANKLGDSLLQAQLKHMQTSRLLTAPEIATAGFTPGTVASKDMDGTIHVLNRPNTGLPKGYQYAPNPIDPDGPQIQTFIPGGPADPAVIAKNAGGRAAATIAAKPKKPGVVDDSGVPPWQRSWK